MINSSEFFADAHHIIKDFFIFASKVKLFENLILWGNKNNDLIH